MSNSPFIVDVTQQNFQQVVVEGSRRQPVVVDFWADWCQPCKMLMPILAKLAEEYRGAFVLAKVNADAEQAVAGYFQVRSLPTVMVFKDGRVVEQFVGVQPEGAIRALLDRHLVKPSDQLRAQARELAAGGRLDEALAVLQQAAQLAPGDHMIRLDIARIAVASGDVAAARQVYDSLPANVREEPEAKALKAQLKFIDLLPGLPEAAALEQRLAANPKDSEADYQLAIHEIAGGDYEGAMTRLFALAQRDRHYGEDLARKTLLELFDLLGADDPLVKSFRRKLFAAMY